MFIDDGDIHSANWPERLRRHDASRYLLVARGVHIAPATLAKLAVKGGGPRYELWGRIPYYPTDWLDDWVESRLTPRSSTSDRGPSERRHKPDKGADKTNTSVPCRADAPFKFDGERTRNKTQDSPQPHGGRRRTPTPLR